LNSLKPKVTVLMPVYNGEKYLKEAIDSILQQTFSDFELLIVEGGSKDNSLKIIQEYQDTRIRIIYQDKEKPGVSAAANQGFENAKGEYIARMDCDDISHPERLQKQVDFMDANTKIGICGTLIITQIDGKLGRVPNFPISFDEIRVTLFYVPPFAQPSIMIRSSMLKENNLMYDTKFAYGEDYDLFIRCSEYFQLANLPEVLLTYRIRPTSLYRSKKKELTNHLISIHKRNLSSLNIDLNEENYSYHRFLIDPTYLENRELVEKMDVWIQNIYEANLKHEKYPVKLFNQSLANRWFTMSFKSKRLGFWTWKKFWQSPLSKYNTVSKYLKLKFVIGAIIFCIGRFFRK